MATIALSITVVLYFGTSVGYVVSGRYGLALAFLCYAIANVGFIIEGMR